jgi:aspartyl-tRNA(Asn)/glutamyl-tRNA(Gln) amidotransferase subunit A
MVEMTLMTETPLHWLTISELSQRIRHGALSPVELTEHLLSRLAAMDGTLHAFKLVARERALAQAQAAEWALKAGQDVGPLHGIPYAAKDLFDAKGLPTTAGSNLLEHNIAAADATVIRRLTQAGMVLLGKTHTVQFAYGGVGINHHHGTPHNPWHAVPHAPGGSSSGSGVAVAAGMVPMALGSDTGGSVRIPSSLCGTVGLKTTVGQISRAGVFPSVGLSTLWGP